MKLRNEANDKLVAAYQSLIAEIRPVGGPAIFSAESDQEAVDVMKESVSEHYPTDWLTYHNDGGEVILQTTTEDASYNPEFVSESEDDGVPKAVVLESTYTMNPNDKEHTAILATIRETLPDVQVTIYSLSGAYGQEVFFKSEQDELYEERIHGVMSEEERLQSGWEHRPTLLSMEFMGDDPSKSFEESLQMLKKPRWVRREMTTRKAGKVLTVNNRTVADEAVKKNQNLLVGDIRKAVAYHEFGHRMEDVMPDDKLARYERAFLKRRTGKTDENFHESMVTGTVRSDIYHDGGFVTKYTGRSYANSKYCEVFTTGIESLYGGTMGGLVGNSNTVSNTDLDHRGFVLGALATL